MPGLQNHDSDDSEEDETEVNSFAEGAGPRKSPQVKGGPVEDSLPTVKDQLKDYLKRGSHGFPQLDDSKANEYIKQLDKDDLSTIDEGKRRLKEIIEEDQIKEKKMKDLEKKFEEGKKMQQETEKKLEVEKTKLQKSKEEIKAAQEKLIKHKVFTQKLIKDKLQMSSAEKVTTQDVDLEKLLSDGPMERKVILIKYQSRVRKNLAKLWKLSTETST